MPPAVEAWSPNHWTAREFPVIKVIKKEIEKETSVNISGFWNILIL